MSIPGPDFDAADLEEIERLASRSKQMSRRNALVATGRVLAFAIPALATFTVSRKALGQTGSISGMGGSSPGSSPGKGHDSGRRM